MLQVEEGDVVVLLPLTPPPPPLLLLLLQFKQVARVPWLLVLPVQSLEEHRL